MQVNVVKTDKPKRIVGSMKPNEVFKIGGYWYIPISMDEDACYWQRLSKVLGNSCRNYPWVS